MGFGLLRLLCQLLGAESQSRFVGVGSCCPRQEDIHTWTGKHRWLPTMNFLDTQLEYCTPMDSHILGEDSRNWKNWYLEQHQHLWEYAYLQKTRYTQENCRSRMAKKVSKKRKVLVFRSVNRLRQLTVVSVVILRLLLLDFTVAGSSSLSSLASGSLL